MSSPSSISTRSFLTVQIPQTPGPTKRTSITPEKRAINQVYKTVIDKNPSRNVSSPIYINNSQKKAQYVEDEQEPSSFAVSYHSNTSFYEEPTPLGTISLGTASPQKPPLTRLTNATGTTEKTQIFAKRYLTFSDQENVKPKQHHTYPDTWKEETQFLFDEDNLEKS